MDKRSPCGRGVTSLLHYKMKMSREATAAERLSGAKFVNRKSIDYTVARISTRSTGSRTPSQPNTARSNYASVSRSDSVENAQQEQRVARTVKGQV